MLINGDECLQAVADGCPQQEGGFARGSLKRRIQGCAALLRRLANSLNPPTKRQWRIAQSRPTAQPHFQAAPTA